MRADARELVGAEAEHPPAVGKTYILITYEASCSPRVIITDLANHRID